MNRKIKGLTRLFERLPSPFVKFIFICENIYGNTHESCALKFHYNGKVFQHWIRKKNEM